MSSYLPSFCVVRAKQVAVRSKISWLWYLAAWSLICIISLLLAFAVVRWYWPKLNVNNLTVPQIENDLRSRIVKLEAELTEAHKLAGTEESSTEMALTTQKKLLERLRILERDNIELKEDIKVFERLGLKGNSDKGITLKRASIRNDLSNPERYRYHLLISYQSSSRKRKGVFIGKLQFRLKGVDSKGKRVSLKLPQNGDSQLSSYQLRVSGIESKDGYLEIPAAMKNVAFDQAEVRIYRKNRLRARHKVTVNNPLPELILTGDKPALGLISALPADPKKKAAVNKEKKTKKTTAK